MFRESLVVERGLGISDLRSGGFACFCGSLALLRRRRDSSPSEEALGGLYCDFERIRTLRDAPAACARSWFPRQMPKMGMFWLMAHCKDLIVSLHCEGSPGPLLQKRPSHFKLALRGDAVTASRSRVTWDAASKRVLLEVVVERHDN